MAYLSLPWPDNGIGDAVHSPYSDDEWTDMTSSLHTMSRASSGVIVSEAYPDSFKVTAGAGLTVLAGPGEALVDGKYLKSDATSSALSLAAPVSGLNYYLVVLTKDFNLQTVRPALRGPWAALGSVFPTQTDGTAWDLPLALVSVPVLGALVIEDRRLPMAAPGSAMVKLAERTVQASGETTLIFNNIPQIYSSLRLVLQGKASGASPAAAQMHFSDPPAGEYGWVRQAHSSVAASSKTGMAVALAIDIASFPAVGSGGSLSQAASVIVELPNYRGVAWKAATAFYMVPDGDTDVTMVHAAGVWRNEDPIEAIYIVWSAGIAPGSHATLYGIL